MAKTGFYLDAKDFEKNFDELIAQIEYTKSITAQRT